MIKFRPRKTLRDEPAETLPEAGSSPTASTKILRTGIFPRLSQGSLVEKYFAPGSKLVLEVMTLITSTNGGTGTSLTLHVSLVKSSKHTSQTSL
jgi:hypothetical protein